MLWTTYGNIASEGTDGREALASGRAIAHLLKISQKRELMLVTQISDGQLVNRYAYLVGDEGNYKDQCVSIAELGVTGKVALAHNIFLKNTAQPRTK